MSYVTISKTKWKAFAVDKIDTQWNKIIRRLELWVKMAKNWNHRNDVMSCARYHDWKHVRQIGWRSEMEIKNIKITDTKIGKLSENLK